MYDKTYFIVVIANLLVNAHAGCTGGYDFCPRKCTCSVEKGLVSTDCSSLTMDTIPDVFARSSSVINLSRNTLTNVTEYSFIHCSHLRELKLDDNAIANISSRAFLDLQQLRVLLVNGNHLNLRKYSGFLKPLNTTLEYLALDGVDNVSFPHDISNLRSVKTLEIYGMTKLSNKTFKNLRNLTLHHLSLRGGTLVDVEPMAFAPLQELESLDLSGNRNLAFESSHWNGWYGLKWTRIEKLNLTSVVKNPESGCNQLTESFFSNLDQTYLKEIYLDYNGIVNIVKKVSTYIPHIEVFSVSFNRLRHLAFDLLADMHNLHNLTYLNLNGQTQNPVLPSEVNSRRGIRSVADMIWFNMPPKLEYFLMSGTHSAPGFTVQPFMLSGNVSNLKKMELSHNNIKSINSPIIIPSTSSISVQVLNLSNNLVEHFPTPMRVDGRMRMKTLDLSHNNLGGLVRGDIEGRLLEDMDKVQLHILNLSSNDIRIFPSHLLKNVHTVSSLVISSNGLSVWNTTVSSMHNLTFLDLSNNLLSSIPKERCDEFDAVAKNHPIRLDLQNNRLECVCTTLLFLRWLHTTNVQFIDLDNYTCFYRGSQVAFHQLPIIIHELTLDCSSKTWVEVTSILLVGIIVLIILVLVIYHNRWAIRYFCLKTLRSSRRYQLLQDNQPYMYVYNAFVAYHQNDLAWVRRELMENVEQHPQHEQLKLCIHHRDWLPGETIADNIMDSVSTSAKTIVVLSESFLHSHWCDFEIQMARMRSFDEGRNVIIIVALEDIPLAKMNGTLISLRRTNTWLMWPQELSDRPAFWQKLREAIRFSSSEPVRCECGRVTYPDGTTNC